MLSKLNIIYVGQRADVHCDGNCRKAWGVERPKIQLSDDEDDYVALADDELPDAPECNGWWEGGDGKPRTPKARLNKWCIRQCERSVIAERDEVVKLPDWSKRRYNQPWKHEGGNV